MIDIHEKDYESVGEVYCKAVACKYTVGRTCQRVNLSVFCRSHLIGLSSVVSVTVIYRHVMSSL